MVGGEKMTDHIQKMIEETNTLFDAVQTVGNEARRKVGFNKPYEFSPGLSATYELYDKGPEQLHYGQYSHLNDLECGNQVDPTKNNYLTREELYLEMEKLYRRITIKDGEHPVCRIEGRQGFRMSLHEDGDWEGKLKTWFKEDGGVLR